MTDKPGTPQDRRKHKRAEDVFIVTYRLRSPFEVAVVAGTREYAAVAMDISEGGIGIDVAQEIPAGTQVLLKFNIVNELSASEQHRQRAFSLGGESRYCRLMKKESYRAGILFKDASAEDRAFISAYVLDQALKKYVS